MATIKLINPSHPILLEFSSEAAIQFDRFSLEVNNNNLSWDNEFPPYQLVPSFVACVYAYMRPHANTPNVNFHHYQEHPLPTQIHWQYLKQPETEKELHYQRLEVFLGFPKEFILDDIKESSSGYIYWISTIKEEGKGSTFVRKRILLPDQLTSNLSFPIIAPLSEASFFSFF